MVEFVSPHRDAKVTVQSSGKATIIAFEKGIPIDITDTYTIDGLRRLTFIEEVLV